MNSTDVVEIAYEGQVGDCLVPRVELKRLQATNKSPRAIRQKILASYRPDVIWCEQGEWRYDHLKRGVNYRQQSVLSGGSELSNLITEADSHLVAMRKTVQ